MRVVVFGIGGVGSHVAYMLRKVHMQNPFFDEVLLVDHDAIEAKNITRQMFPDNAIGEMKSIVSAEGMTSDALNFKAFTFNV